MCQAISKRRGFSHFHKPSIDWFHSFLPFLPNKILYSINSWHEMLTTNKTTILCHKIQSVAGLLKMHILEWYNFRFEVTIGCKNLITASYPSELVVQFGLGLS